MSLERNIVNTRRDSENPNPSYTFPCYARIDVGSMFLFTEGSPTLTATWTLTQVRYLGKDGEEKETIIREFHCPMPTSYQNFTVIDVPDVEVLEGDRFDFSVNDPDCICDFVMDCYSADPLNPSSDIAPLGKVLKEEPEEEPTP